MGCSSTPGWPARARMRSYLPSTRWVAITSPESWIVLFHFWYHPLNATTAFPHPFISRAYGWRCAESLELYWSRAIRLAIYAADAQPVASGNIGLPPLSFTGGAPSRSLARAGGGYPSCTGTAHPSRQAHPIGSPGSASPASGSSITLTAGSRQPIWLSLLKVARHQSVSALAA